MDLQSDKNPLEAQKRDLSSVETADIENGTSTLKTGPGGDALDPQPSNDENDPLNWSQAKKMTILLVVSATAFLPDYGSATGAVTSVVQSNLLCVSSRVMRLHAYM